MIYLSLTRFKIEKNNQRLFQLISKSNAELEVMTNSYANHGCTYCGLGQFKRAIKYHQRHLEIAKEMGDKAREGVSYRNLGNAYQGLGQFKTAIEYHQRHLEIAKEVGDKTGEGRSYSNLGNTYQGLRQFKTAIEYHQRHLDIVKKVRDKAGEGTSNGNLGKAYQGLGQFKTAIEYHQRHLEIAKEVGDKVEEGISYGGLGNAYQGLLKFKTAIEYHQRPLEIAKEKGDKVEEGKSYDSLGNAFQGVGQLKTAIEYHQRHLEISKEVGDKAREGTSYGNLGNAYQGLGQFITAMECHKRHLKIFKEVGDKTGEACALCFLGIIFECQGSLQKAFSCYHSSVEVYDDIRASLQPDDEWKLCFRNQHERAYKGLWRVNLSQGKIVKALLAAEKGCTQALRDLMDTKYYPGSSSTYRASCVSLSCVPLDTIFMAVSGPCVNFWVFLSNDDIKVRKVHVNNYKHQRELEFLKRISSVALVHIAAHTKMETGEVILAPNTTRENPQPQEKDYLLTMEDVIEAGLRARLVVLSCYYTARGEVTAEGVVGMARALLGSGARSVVVTLWVIGDEETLEFMSFLYDALAKGKKESEALDHAMKCMREIEKFKEVKHWTPFVLIGDDVNLDFKKI